MRNTDDERAEIEAAKQRLKRFGKPANQCKNQHNPERLQAAKEGRQYVPPSTWRELGRRFQLI